MLREWLRQHLQVSGILLVSRRWFITNAFDGTLSILGIIMGMFAVKILNPRIVLAAGAGVCVALSISQSVGNFMAERAERLRTLKELQAAMVDELKESIHADTTTTAPVIAGFVGGVLPAAYTSLSLLPFLVSSFGFITAEQAFYSSFGMIFALIFLLGTLLGIISKESILSSGLKMMALSVATALILLLLGAM